MQICFLSLSLLIITANTYTTPGPGHVSLQHPTSVTSPINFSPSTFRPSPLWRNKHVQTIFGALYREERDFTGTIYRRQTIATPDGDFFDVDIRVRNPNPAATTTTPLKIVVQTHGLESTSTSPLCQSMADDFIRVGGVDEVHTICFRGCSGSPNKTPGAYHLGFTADLKHYLSLLSSSTPNARVFLSGFSLGANVVLKCLGELGDSASSLNIAGAAVTCVPYDCEVRTFERRVSIDNNV